MTLCDKSMKSQHLGRNGTSQKCSDQVTANLTLRYIIADFILFDNIPVDFHMSNFVIGWVDLGRVREQDMFMSRGGMYDTNLLLKLFM